jgi:hypothetical protein
VLTSEKHVTVKKTKIKCSLTQVNIFLNILFLAEVFTKKIILGYDNPQEQIHVRKLGSTSECDGIVWIEIISSGFGTSGWLL